ncbi:MAG TPA: hypothetical protein VGK73_33360 [Polyangiaceae bacterium]
MPAPLPAPVGKRFGAVVIISDAPPIQAVGRMRRQWRFRCDCGREQDGMVSPLNAGRILQCSECAERQRLARITRHGHARVGRQASEYFVWNGLRSRCNNPKNKDYKRYGGRGIRCCARWADFAAFLEDVGRRPSRQHSLDRIKNELHYSCGKCNECVANGWPANCRWATAKEQQRNKRTNHLLTFRGRTQCVSAWAEELGSTENVILHRLQSGHSIEIALGVEVMPGQVLDQDTDGRTSGSFVDRVRLELLDGERATDLAARIGESHKRVRGALLRLKYRRVVTMDRHRRWRRCG